MRTKHAKLASHPPHLAPPSSDGACALPAAANRPGSDHDSPVSAHMPSRPQPRFRGGRDAKPSLHSPQTRPQHGRGRTTDPISSGSVPISQLPLRRSKRLGPTAFGPSGVSSQMYETLSRHLDDPQVVRFCPDSGSIVAATPARLVAYITSPDSIDYRLLSDFFLIFRLFIAPIDLLAHLFARLRWAIDRFDSTGRAARVRTFVAIRHWILNYFSDDFVSDHELCSSFCDAINRLSDFLTMSRGRHSGDLNIVLELKKCWARASATFRTPATLCVAGATSQLPLNHIASLSQERVIDSEKRLENTSSTSPDKPDSSSPSPGHGGGGVDIGIGGPSAFSGTLIRGMQYHPYSAFADIPLGTADASTCALTAPQQSPTSSSRHFTPMSCLPPLARCVNRNVLALAHRAPGSETGSRGLNCAHSPACLQPIPDLFKKSGREPSGATNEPLGQIGAACQHPDRQDALLARAYAIFRSLTTSPVGRDHSDHQVHTRDIPSSLATTQSSAGCHRAGPLKFLTEASRELQIANPDVPSFASLNTSYTGSFGADENVFSPVDPGVDLRPCESSAPAEVSVDKNTSDQQLQDFNSLSDFNSRPTILAYECSTHFAELVSDGGSNPLHLSQEGFVRLLRRRPGGNLRGVNNASELAPRLTRLYSGDSESTLHHKIAVSDVDSSSWCRPSRDLADGSSMSVSTSQSSHGREDAHPAMGQKVESSDIVRFISLFDSHSSRQALSPSFESMAAKLAALPDRPCGGVEETLMKLEGRYCELDKVATSAPPGDMNGLYSHEDGGVCLDPVPLEASHRLGFPTCRFQPAMSENDIFNCNARSQERIPCPAEESVVHDLESVSSTWARCQLGSALLRSPALSNSDTPSSSSTTASDEGVPLPTSDGPLNSDSTHGCSNILAKTSCFGAAPSGNPNLAFPLRRNCCEGRPTQPHLPFARDSQTRLEMVGETFNCPSVPAPIPAKTPHVAFVLAYEPELVASQMTVIEQDVLDEVSWQELVNMQWSQVPIDVRDWASFLAGHPPRGIDVVFARFNLVVKWIISEIVLTTSLEERVRTVIRFLQIAQHAYRLNNYATTFQICLALLSSDLSSFRSMWNAVPACHMLALAEMADFTLPKRNFGKLRQEMDRVLQAGDVACVPFIGIFTHDLMLNAQKPAFLPPPVPSTPHTRFPEEIVERLVNFERFRNSALIIKQLLRLLEASARYRIQPVPEVLSKCLWISALSDGQIKELCAQWNLP